MHPEKDYDGPVEVRDTEISREVHLLRSQAEETAKLSELLIQRLAPVISPKGTNSSPGDVARKEVATPLGTSLNQTRNLIAKTNQSLSFILSGIEL